MHGNAGRREQSKCSRDTSCKTAGCQANAAYGVNAAGQSGDLDLAFNLANGLDQLAAEAYDLKRLFAADELRQQAGDCDFLLRVVATDLDGYRQFQAKHLARIKGVQNLKTEIPMQKVKLTTELPI